VNFNSLCREQDLKISVQLEERIKLDSWREILPRPSHVLMLVIMPPDCMEDSSEFSVAHNIFYET
jgi:hypothetical protein